MWEDIGCSQALKKIYGKMAGYLLSLTVEENL